MDNPRMSTRYPTTMAYDCLRTFAGASVSRAQMSQIVKKIAEVIDMDRGELIRKIADWSIDNADEVEAQSDHNARLIVRDLTNLLTGEE